LQVKVWWSAPAGEGNSYLSSYEVRLFSRTGDLLETQQLLTNFCILNNLAPASEYAIGLVSVCKHVYGLQAKFHLLNDQIREIRSESLRVPFVTPPRRPENLSLERSEPTALKVRWDDSGTEAGGPPDMVKVTYIVTVSRAGDVDLENRSGVQAGHEVLDEKRTDSNVFTLSGLPASGVAYLVGVRAVVYHNTKPLYSDTTSGVFATRPHPPTELTVLDHATQVAIILSHLFFIIITDAQFNILH
jgi:hypothetical protein